MKKKLLIFDCDGVIVESENLAINIVMEQLNKIGINVSFKETENLFIGRSLREGIQLVEDFYRINLPPHFSQNCNSETIKIFKERLKPVKNFHHTIKKIKNDKCVASGSDPERLKISLQITDTQQYFSELFSTALVKKGKPFPDIFLYVAHKMNYSIEDCIVIEDSKVGVKAGIAAGMNVIWYQRNEEIDEIVFDKVLIIRDIKELPNAITKFEI